MKREHFIGSTHEHMSLVVMVVEYAVTLFHLLHFAEPFNFN